MDTVFKGAVFRIFTEYKAGPNADHFTDIVISFLNESIFWLDCFHLSTSCAPEFHMLGEKEIFWSGNSTSPNALHLIVNQNFCNVMTH